MFKTIAATATCLLSLSAFTQGVEVLNSHDLDLEGLGRNVSFKMKKNIIIPAGKREVLFCKKETPFFLNGKIHDCSVEGKVITGTPSTDARALPVEVNGTQTYVNSFSNIVGEMYKSKKIYQYILSDNFDMKYEVQCKSADGDESPLFGTAFNIELTPGHLKGICSDAIETIGAKISLVEINNSDSAVGESLNRCANVSSTNRNDHENINTDAYSPANLGMSINTGSNLR